MVGCFWFFSLNLAKHSSAFSLLTSGYPISNENQNSTRCPFLFQLFPSSHPKLTVGRTPYGGGPGRRTLPQHCCRAPMDPMASTYTQASASSLFSFS